MGHVKLPFSETIYMAYQYEDLNNRGLLVDEEEVSSSNKVESETDLPEASKMSEVSKKPSAKRKRAKSDKDPVMTATCSSCNRPGHLAAGCKSWNQRRKNKFKPKIGFQENRKCNR